MAQTAHLVKRIQDPAPPASLMSIDPQKNWHRFPSPITAAMLLKTDAAAKAVTYTGGVANTGAAAGNAGETGTINQTGPAMAPLTQAAKLTAGNLTPGTIQAVDITKSYHGTRGSLAPLDPYPTGNKPPSGITLSVSTVSGATAGTTVGTLTATDPNVGDTFTFTLVDSAYGKFQLTAPNTVKTNSRINAGVYSIRVRATDQTGLWLEITFPITVT
jgi:hypothetical protein